MIVYWNWQELACFSFEKKGFAWCAATYKFAANFQVYILDVQHACVNTQQLSQEG